MSLFGKIAHIDFETRSFTDLTARGLDKYCEDPTTDVMVLGYAFDDFQVEQWRPAQDEWPVADPHDLFHHVRQGGLVYAHNAQFELNIWNRICCPKYGWPALSIGQTRCTMAMALALSLPGGLENALAAVGAPERKDEDGRRAMLALASPVNGEWVTDADFVQRMLAYNVQDVVAERTLCTYLAPLSDAEQLVWQLDQRINARGIPFDRPAVLNARELVADEKDEYDRQIKEGTGGAVKTVMSHTALRKWVNDQGVSADSVDKDAVQRLLGSSGTPEPVKKVLAVRQIAGRSSTAKLNAILSYGGEDNRIRYWGQYHGAGPGRWTGRDVQPHNFPRAKPPCEEYSDIEYLCDLLHKDINVARNTIELLFGAPMRVMPSLLKGMLRAEPGSVFIGGDFSNIEGRGIAWSAGEQWKLDAFRAYDAGTGPDLYKLAYSRAFNIDIGAVLREQRQVGKVMELALGYQGWVGSFISMAANYGVSLPEDVVIACCRGWRSAHPRIKKYWGALEVAALEACKNPGMAVPATGGVTFLRHAMFLYIRLPSGRMLAYPWPRIEIQRRVFENEDGSEYVEERETVVYVGYSGERWGDVFTYGGYWSENITQAIARDILVEAMLRMEDAGLPIVLHVHDEAIAEIHEINTTTSEEVARIMGQVPTWAEGFPIAVNHYRHRRYGK